MKATTLNQKAMIVGWVIAGLIAAFFLTAAITYVVKETKAGHINWSN